MNTNNFNKKTAVIIGGTSGMGKATAKLLLSLGVTVVVASRTEKSVTEAVDELSAIGQVSGLQVDVTSELSVDSFIGSMGKIAKIDYLVNASGIFRPKPFLDNTADEYDALLNINKGFYFITQAIARKMKENGGGAIVNVGSYWATHAIKGTPTAAYSMAKAGLQAFTQQIAMELAAYKIRVNAIAPGVVETNVLNALIDSKEGVRDAYAGLNGIHPMGRNGQADEIANTIVHLLSDSTAWVTGAVWNIDGGMSAGRS